MKKEYKKIKDKEENYSLEDVLISWDKSLKGSWGYGLKEAGMNEKLKGIILNWVWGEPFHKQSSEIKFLIKSLLL